MSTHSYSRCWLHMIWETLRREPMLDRRAAAKASTNLTEYSCEKGIYMKINYLNADHTHALIDLPTNLNIEQVVQLLKGGSSHWINHNRLIKDRFAWDVATELSRPHIQTWTESVNTSQTRENITARELLTKNTNFSSSDTVWNGGMRQTVKTVRYIFFPTTVTRLKPGVNEKISYELRR